jgi:hypothetical protein
MPVSLPGKSVRPLAEAPGSKSRSSKRSKGMKKLDIPLVTSGATCVILTPHDPVGTLIKNAIQQAMAKIEVNALLLEDYRPGAAWVKAVTDAIKFSAFIIVDISQQDPNVMYELGYAHALRKPTILLMSLDSKLPPPSDLEGILYITYDPKNLQSLKEEVAQSARQYQI